MKECEERRTQLGALMRKLEMEEALLKFHQTTSSSRYPGALPFLCPGCPPTPTRLGRGQALSQGARCQPACSCSAAELGTPHAHVAAPEPLNLAQHPTPPSGLCHLPPHRTRQL